MNLKSFLLAFGLLGTSAAAATATACSCSTKHDTDADIVHSVNTYAYEAQIIEGEASYDNALAEITKDFVKFELSADLKAKFNDDKFQLLRITDLDGVQLPNEVFTQAKEGDTIKAKFVYDYGKFTKQVGWIHFPVISNNQGKIIDAINAAMYDFTVDINSSYREDLKLKITPDFIKAKLSPSIQAIFESSQFRLFSISDDNWKELDDPDLTNFSEVDVRINYGYFTVKNETTNLHLKVIALNEDTIVSNINQVSYQTSIAIKKKYVDLMSYVGLPFIKKELTNQSQTDFNDSALNVIAVTFSDGTQISDTDLETVQVINAKINYDYGLTKNQNTNVTVNVEKMKLSDVLRDFEVRDRKNIVGFLNGNSLQILASQIQDYLSINNFEEAGLEFVNRTSNSIDVHAKDTSAEYQGQITITWKLKLFEVWGLGVSGETDSDLNNGLKGYFYLEDNNGTKLVKYFNAYGYLTGRKADIHYYKDVYHRFIFKNNNNQTKDFTINGKWKTDEVAAWFDSFAFTTGMTVVINSPEPNRIKFFNSTTQQWNNAINKTYTVNNLGTVS